MIGNDPGNRNLKMGFGAIAKAPGEVDRVDKAWQEALRAGVDDVAFGNAVAFYFLCKPTDMSKLAVAKRIGRQPIAAVPGTADPARDSQLIPAGSGYAGPVPPGFASKEAFAAYLRGAGSSKSETTIHTGNLIPMVEMVKKVLPEYPENARKAGVEGKVQLSVIVGKNGNVEEVKAIVGPEMLITSAEGAVKQCVFKPFMANGKPVRIAGRVTAIYLLTAAQPVNYK